MPRGRGRGGFNPSYFDENHKHGRTDEPGGSRKHVFHDVQLHNRNRNAVNEHDFGPQIGDPRHEFYYNSHSAVRPEPNRMMKFMPDPRLQPKIIPHGVDQYPYSSNENPNYTMDEQICNIRGKTLRSPKNVCPLVGITRLVKPGSRSNDRRHDQHLNEERFDRQFSSNCHDSSVVDENIQQDMNLDSIVHNLLDSLDDGINYDDQSRHRNEESEEEPEDFPTRYANYQRSFDEFEKHAVALSCDPRLQKATSFSAQPSSGPTSSKENSQPASRVKSEPREKITGPQKDDLNPENNLKQALEDIRQRQQIPSTTTPCIPSYSEIAKSKPSNTSKNKISSEPHPKKVTPPKVSSNKKDGKGPHQSPEGNDKSNKTHRKVVEDSGSRNSSRSSRNSSPAVDRRRRNVSGRLVLGSPEWHRQVRMVDEPESRNRDSREREMRRVRRLSQTRSRSRSRSRSSRRTQRYFRYGSPERLSRSRSPVSRRPRRVSPEYPHRRWGTSGPIRNSRSPVRTRDRRRSPPDYSHRHVVERTVIMRQRSRSFSRSRSCSRSPSRSLSQQRQNCKRLKDHRDMSSRDKQQQQPPPTTSSSSSNSAVNVDSPVSLPTTQLFTRNYVVANQVDHVAHAVQPMQPVQTPVTATRYVGPANTVPHNVSTIPPLMGYDYNHQQHYQTTAQQQMDIITYQQQQQQHHLLQQQQQQLHQKNLQQMNQNPVAYKNVSASAFIPIVHSNVVVHSPAQHNIPTPQTLPNPSSTSTKPVAALTTNSEGGSVEEQRTRITRDGLLEKQANLIHQLLVLQGQQADLEMKQKTAEDGEYERLSNNIIEKAKFGKEMMVSAQSLEKIIQKHTNQLKEDLSELKKTRSANRYNYYDPQQHWCELCDVITDKLSDYLNHLHSKEHEERLQSTGVPSTPWHKKRSITSEEKGGIRIPFNGLQNLLPVKAWYCELCDVWIGDLLCAKLHMSSSSHNDQHLKRNMDRPDSSLNHTTKKQAALRRNLIRKKEEERIRNQQKDAEKMKIDAERKEVAKKRDDELKEKQRLLNEKWQDFVRNEEANNASIVELEGEPTGEKNAPIERPSDGSTSSSIRLNIRTPLMTLKTPDQDDAAQTPNLSLMETSDSIEGQVILIEKETSAELSEKEVFIDSSNKESSKQRATLDVQTETSVVKQTESIIRPGESEIEEPPYFEGVAEKAVVPDSLPVNSNDEAQNNPPSISRDDEAAKDIPESSNLKVAQLSVEEQQSRAIIFEERDVCERMDTSTCEISPEKSGETDNSMLINTPEQIVPVSQNNVIPAAATRAPGEVVDADRTFVREQNQQVDENSQDQLDSSVKAAIDPECLDVQGNIENVPQHSPESFVVSDKVLECVIEGSQKDSIPDDSVLLPKIEPIDNEDQISDCCVILEVNPKLSKVPEIIDLESSSEECDQQATESHKQMEVGENSEHFVILSEICEDKCDSLLVGDNRSSTPCKIQFGEFIVLSETTEDSSGIDADSRASINSTSELSSGERLVAAEEAPGDEAATNQIP